MYYNHSKLIGRIVEKCGSREKFCEEMGMTYTTFFNKTRNITDFTRDEIYRAIKILNISADEIPQYFFCVVS